MTAFDLLFAPLTLEKRQKAGRVFYEQGRETKDFFVPCDPAEGRQPWL